MTWGGRQGLKKKLADFWIGRLNLRTFPSTADTSPDGYQPEENHFNRTLEGNLILRKTYLNQPKYGQVGLVIASLILQLSQANTSNMLQFLCVCLSTQIFSSQATSFLGANRGQSSCKYCFKKITYAKIERITQAHVLPPSVQWSPLTNFSSAKCPFDQMLSRPNAGSANRWFGQTLVRPNGSEPMRVTAKNVSEPFFASKTSKASSELFIVEA